MAGYLFYLFFPPMAFLLFKNIIITYDHKFDVSGWRRFVSYHGVNLQFWKLNRTQWKLLTEKFAPRYFKTASVIDLGVNMIIILFIRDNNMMPVCILAVYLFLLVLTMVIIKKSLNRYK